jgi:MFS family permease
LQPRDPFADGRISIVTDILDRNRAMLAWTLFMLFVMNMMNSADRVLFSILQELIKADLRLTDFQLGLLGGPAFALLYTFAAFPIARFADRHNRVNIISIVFFAWSLMTIACGLAGSFFQMLLARGGVSIGEAGSTPSSHSLISDLFPVSWRMTAISVFAAAASVGALIAAAGGASLAQHVGWRETFYLCGFIGIPLALLMRMTLREPPRDVAVQSRRLAGFAATICFMLGKRSFAIAATAGALASFAINAINQYFVSFLIRAHHLSLTDAGAIMGIAVGAIGIFSTMLVGPLVDRSRRRFPRMRTWLPAAGLMWCGTLYALAFMAANTHMTVTLLFLAACGQTFWVPAIYTVAQDVAPPTMRSTSAALMIAIVSVVGYGLGPPLVGLASDMLSHMAMRQSHLNPASCAITASEACAAAISSGLRLSLSVGAVAFILGGLLFLLSSRTIERDMYGN